MYMFVWTIVFLSGHFVLSLSNSYQGAVMLTRSFSKTTVVYIATERFQVLIVPSNTVAVLARTHNQEHDLCNTILVIESL